MLAKNFATKPFARALSRRALCSRRPPPADATDAHIASGHVSHIPISANDPPSPRTNDPPSSTTTDTTSSSSTTATATTDRGAVLETSRLRGDSYASVPRAVQGRARASLRIDTPGLAAMVHATIPPGTSVRCSAGALIGASRGAAVRTVLAAGPLGSVLRAAAGGTAFLDEISNENARVADGGGGAAEASNGGAAAGGGGSRERDVDALFAPRSLGDVCVIRLDHAWPLHVRVGCVLAAADGVSLEAGRNAHGSLGGRFVTVASGSGDMAVTSFGAIFRVALGPNDAYWVNPSHVIAWHGSVSEVDKHRPGIVERIGASVARYSGGSGKRGLVCVQGPGDLFLQSRSERKTSAQKVREDREELEILKDGDAARSAREEDTRESIDAAPRRGFFSRIFGR